MHESAKKAVSIVCGPFKARFNDKAFRNEKYFVI